jgi:hypothetical protein
MYAISLISLTATGILTLNGSIKCAYLDLTGSTLFLLLLAIRALLTVLSSCWWGRSYRLLATSSATKDKTKFVSPLLITTKAGHACRALSLTKLTL